MTEALSDIILIAKEVVTPALPLFLLTILGWGVFSSPQATPAGRKDNKTKGQHYPSLDQDELVPLGPMAEAQKKRADKLARTKGKAAGKTAMTEKLVRQANNNPIKQPQSHRNTGHRH